MTDEELLALYSAVPTGAAPKPPDPKWLERSRHQQNAAAAQVEADELLREPTLGEKTASFAQGAAEAASFGVSPYAKGAMKALGPLALGGAAGLVVDDPIAGIPKRFREGVESQQEGRASMQEGKLGAAYGYGQGAVDLANTAAGVVAPARSALVAAEDVLAGAPVRQVVSSGLAPIKGAVASVLRKLGANADKNRILTIVGEGGTSPRAKQLLAEVTRVPGGEKAFADMLRKEGISTGFDRPAQIAEKAYALEEKAGAKIGELIDDATNSGGFVDTKDLVTRLRAEAAQVDAAAGIPEATVSASSHAEELRRLADVVERAAPGGVMKPDRVKAWTTSLSEDARNAYRASSRDMKVPGVGKALMDTRRLGEAQIDETLQGLGVAEGVYTGAKRQNQVARIAAQFAETDAERALVNQPLSLIGGLLFTKDPKIATVYEIIRPFIRGGRAVLPETAQRLAAALDPGAVAALGPGGAQLAQAAAAGPKALQGFLEQVSRTDPYITGALAVGAMAGEDDDDLDDVARMRALAR